MATSRSLSPFLCVSLAVVFTGCSRGATKGRGPAADASDAGTPDADADAAIDADAPAAIDAGDDADAPAPALLSPIRFHLRNDGPGDVYLGLRFIDRCAFDYTVTRLAGASSVVIEQPMCPCRPDCSDCATCRPASCDELCDEDPPRIAPGQERVLTWDGRVFDFVALCGGAARCAAASPAAPGRYSLTVPVYDRAVQPTSGVAPARSATVSIDLGGASVEGTDVALSIHLP